MPESLASPAFQAGWATSCVGSPSASVMRRRACRRSSQVRIVHQGVGALVFARACSCWDFPTAFWFTTDSAATPVVRPRSPRERRSQRRLSTRARLCIWMAWLGEAGGKGGASFDPIVGDHRIITALPSPLPPSSNSPFPPSLLPLLLLSLPVRSMVAERRLES